MAEVGFEIDLLRFYTEQELRLTSIFTEDVLRRARKKGLKCKEVSRGKRVYLGKWILDWLNSDDQPTA